LGCVSLMRIATRNTSHDELARKYERISFFERNRRRVAREEAAVGSVEIIDFRVQRVWSLITCAGPPCCPNTWLLQTSEGEFLRLESWCHLARVNDSFPGDQLQLSVWPLSRRILATLIRGVPLPILDTPEFLTDFDVPGGGSSLRNCCGSTGTRSIGRNRSLTQPLNLTRPVAAPTYLTTFKLWYSAE
jgi:hypothetical protein